LVRDPFDVPKKADAVAAGHVAGQRSSKRAKKTRTAASAADPTAEEVRVAYRKALGAVFTREYGFNFDQKLAAPADTSATKGRKGKGGKKGGKKAAVETVERRIFVDDVRVRGVGSTDLLKQQPVPEATTPSPTPVEHTKTFFESGSGGGWLDTPVYLLEECHAGHSVEGPAIIMNGTSTALIEPGCTAVVTTTGDLRIDIRPIEENARAEAATKPEVVPVDPIMLSVFSNRFISIAEQMGRTLQRTATSVNIKERLDFSCAIFSPAGGLVANAPHVPVHLGAMADTVQVGRLPVQ
jgi:hypothetical protein